MPAFLTLYNVNNNGIKCPLCPVPKWSIPSIDPGTARPSKIKSQGRCAAVVRNQGRLLGADEGRSKLIQQKLNTSQRHKQSENYLRPYLAAFADKCLHRVEPACGGCDAESEAADARIHDVAAVAWAPQPTGMELDDLLTGGPASDATGYVFRNDVPKVAARRPIAIGHILSIARTVCVVVPPRHILGVSLRRRIERLSESQAWKSFSRSLRIDEREGILPQTFKIIDSFQWSLPRHGAGSG